MHHRRRVPDLSDPLISCRESPQEQVLPCTANLRFPSRITGRGDTCCQEKSGCLT